MPEHKKAHQKRLTEALRKMLNDPDGRVALTWLLGSECCGLFRSGLAAGTNKVLILEGQRLVALVIQAQCLAADPSAYQRLISDFIGNSHDRDDSRDDSTDWLRGD